MKSPFSCFRNENPGFKRIVEKLERSPVCQRLPFRSFLVLPFQRITRIKLLVQVCARVCLCLRACVRVFLFNTLKFSFSLSRTLWRELLLAPQRQLTPSSLWNSWKRYRTLLYSTFFFSKHKLGRRLFKIRLIDEFWGTISIYGTLSALFSPSILADSRGQRQHHSDEKHRVSGVSQCKGRLRVQGEETKTPMMQYSIFHVIECATGKPWLLSKVSILFLADPPSDQPVPPAGARRPRHRADWFLLKGHGEEYLFALIQRLPADVTTKRVSRNMMSDVGLWVTMWF